MPNTTPAGDPSHSKGADLWGDALHPRTASHWAINTTARCQHRCCYCFEGDREGLRDVPGVETRKLIERAAAAVPHVIFMGAEPTLNPELPALIGYAKSLGLLPSISTNALRLADEKFLLALHDAGLADIELSFPYPDASTYAAITGAKQAGFERLLGALDNIEALNSVAADKHAINVNVVVSRYNIDRLPEVVAHVRARLQASPARFTCKRIDCPRTLAHSTFLQDMYVPCLILRQRFAQLASTFDSTFSVGFRDFPLCAIPGLERYDLDLAYWLTGAEVQHNFATQTELQNMYPAARQRARHPFAWHCSRCSLHPICLSRELFVVSGSGLQDRPEPVVGPLSAHLSEWLSPFPVASAALHAPRPAAEDLASAWLLEQLSSLGKAVPDGAVTWEALRTGTFALVGIASSTMVRVWHRATRWQGLRHAGDWAVGELSPACESSGTAAVDAFVRLLASLPSAPDLPPSPPEPFDSAVSTAAGAEEAHIAPISLDVEATAGPSCSASSDEAFATFLLARLHSCPPLVDGLTPSLDSSRGALQVEISPSVFLRICAVPNRGPALEGYLGCGTVLQLPGESLELPAVVHRLHAIASAIAARCADSILCRPGFHTEAWRTFGPALLPRMGASGSLLSGSVSPLEIRLGISTPAGARFELGLLPTTVARNPYCSNGSIALQYHVSQTSSGRADVMGIVERYATMLRKVVAR